MKKLFKNIFFFSIPVIFVSFLIFSYNVIYLDFKFGHQTSMIYHQPFSWQKQLIFSKLKQIKNKIFYQQDLNNITKLNLYISEQNIKKLIAETPNSTKKWVKAKILKTNSEFQDIRFRLRGDNPSNWLKFKKTFRIKTKKNELIDGYRRFDFHILYANYYIPFLVSEKMNLISQSAKIVSVLINDESHGLYVQHEKMDELFLRKNKIMPINIYKGSNNSVERHIGLNTNLFNNPEMWTKLAIFNQQQIEDKTDLKKFFEAINNNENKINASLNDYINLDYFSKFEAFLTIIQNNHHYWRDNLRFIIDPWNGKATQLMTDPVTGKFEKNLLDFSNNNLNSFLNKNTDFIHKKYQWLYYFIKEKKLISAIVEQIKLVENDLNEADTREPYDVKYPSNYTNSFNEEIKNLKKTEQEIINILEKEPNSLWTKKNKKISIMLDSQTPLHDLNFYFLEKDTPEWVGLDLNYDQKISKNEPIFYREKDSSSINLPITLYANRIKKTNTYSKMDHDMEIHLSRTKFNFVTKNNKDPIEIIGKNFFTKKPFQIKLVKDAKGVMLNKYNKIINISSTNDEMKFLEGTIIVSKDLVFDEQVTIKPGTVFEIMPKKNIIFKNKLISKGTKENPIIFKRFKSRNNLKKLKDKNWGTVALLGKKTNGSIVQHSNFIGGSGGNHNQYKFTSMFSIHNTKNIKIINSKFSENDIFDDVIHVVYSNDITFEKIEIIKAFSDAIDVDISKNIKFKNILIKDSNNDGLDFMESDANIVNAEIYGSKDKGLSIGENSKVSIKNSSINNNNIGIAVKDNSSSIIEKSKIENNEVQIAAYAKNWQYGSGGKVKVLNSTISSKKNNFNTLSDPGDIDYLSNQKGESLVQDSKIELLNTQINGEITVKGKNFFNKINQ